MNLTKKLGFVVLSVVILSGCVEEKVEPLNKEKNNVEAHKKKDVKKHDSENLPVTIYIDNDYKIEGQKVGFQRIITSIKIEKFNETNESKFYDFYDSRVRSQGFNLQKDYKMLQVNLKQDSEDEARSRPLEALMLNKGSGLVIGNKELASQNDFLLYQQEFLATDFKVGKTLDETGSILMAIPNEYANNSNLQLRLSQNVNDEIKNIYIDLN